MKKFLIALAVLIFNLQSAYSMPIDQVIDKFISPFSDIFSKIVFYPINILGSQVPITILWIIAGGILMTFFLRGISVWGFKHALSLVLKKPDKNAKDMGEDGTGEVSSLQALATALSGTIGLGSIAGVAISISIGGPGALFWILVGALFGMSLKFVEATLAVKFRRFNKDGSVSGGPMHYIAHGLTRKGLRWLGQPLAMLFAFLLIPGAIGGGNMLQINQATKQITEITGGQNSIFYHNAWLFGLIIAILVALIVIGGIKSIAKVTEKIVPLMCFLYVFIGTIVILTNITHIPQTLAIILKGAFFPDAIYGGVAGTIIIGLRRSVQSSEAGTGSAPIAYATVKTKEPISQGFVSMLEPFISACLCTFTAITIVITGSYKHFYEGVSGIDMTSSAFSSVISWSPIILAIVIILFALSTIISWAYYGQKGWTYMFGEGKKRIIFYQIMFCSFIVCGSSINLKSIIDFTDAGLLAMSVPNIIAMYILIKDIKYDLSVYCKEHCVCSEKIRNLLK